MAPGVQPSRIFNHVLKLMVLVHLVEEKSLFLFSLCIQHGIDVQKPFPKGKNFFPLCSREHNVCITIQVHHLLQVFHAVQHAPLLADVSLQQ